MHVVPVVCVKPGGTIHRAVMPTVRRHVQPVTGIGVNNSFQGALLPLPLGAPNQKVRSFTFR